MGQICLSVPLLLIRSRKTKSGLPLAFFLLATGILAVEPMIASYFPQWSAVYMAFAFPMLFMLSPCLWLYIEAQTAFEPWEIHRKQLRHFLLLWPALVISLMIPLLPEDVFFTLFISNTDVVDPKGVAVAICILIMMLLWIGQCTLTFVRIIKRLNDYRQQLNNFFSNKEGKELKWMSLLLPLMAFIWIFSLAVAFYSNVFNNLIFNESIEAILILILVWSLAHFGLQQEPLKTVTYDVQPPEKQPNSDKVDNKPEANKKYQRSALAEEQATRIAQKIHSVMEEDKLYLDANLSLQKLASYVSISPNYISQTLNQTLDSNFFDFVNHWRIQAAKPLIIANQSTVLNIALSVGFNARSSFYKAFKQETGQTPSEYRKQNS